MSNKMPTNQAIYNFIGPYCRAVPEYGGNPEPRQIYINFGNVPVWYLNIKNINGTLTPEVQITFDGLSWHYVDGIWVTSDTICHNGVYFLQIIEGTALGTIKEIFDIYAFPQQYINRLGITQPQDPMPPTGTWIAEDATINMPLPNTAVEWVTFNPIDYKFTTLDPVRTPGSCLKCNNTKMFYKDEEYCPKCDQ